MLLVDSDILIAHLRGHDRARAFLVDARREHGPLAASVVTVAELTAGMRSGERREVWALLGTLDRKPVDDLIARRAGEFGRRFRSSHRSICVADLLIAATADILGYELATLNVKHFPMFEGLRRPFEV